VPRQLTPGVAQDRGKEAVMKRSEIGSRGGGWGSGCSCSKINGDREDGGETESPREAHEGDGYG
jgi:hypothetical protein